MHQQYQKGVVVNVNHQRKFGFVEEERTKVQYFFHSGRYGSLRINQKDEILFDLGIVVTFPRLGDVFYFIEDGLSMNPRVSVWVYQIDYVAIEAGLLKSRIHRERSQRLQQQRARPRPQWSTPPPPPPPPKPRQQRTWREVLGFRIGERVTLDLIDQKFRTLALVLHPDRGGSHEKMVELTGARAEALRFVA